MADIPKGEESAGQDRTGSLAITGASSFIGKNLLQRLLEREEESAIIVQSA